MPRFMAAVTLAADFTAVTKHNLPMSGPGKMIRTTLSSHTMARTDFVVSGDNLLFLNQFLPRANSFSWMPAELSFDTNFYHDVPPRIWMSSMC